MKKNYTPLLIASFALLAAGLGFFKATSIESTIAQADGLKIEYNGMYIKFGSYPQKIQYQTMMDILDAEAKLIEGNKYEYQGEYYSTAIGEPYSGTIIMPTDVNPAAIDGKKCWFLWQPINWKPVKEDSTNNLTYFVSTVIIDTYRWQTNNAIVPMNDWEQSEMRAFLNGEFLYNAFTSEELQAVARFKSSENTSHKEIEDFVTLLSKSELSKHNELLKANTSDYAAARGLYAPAGDNYYYYLNSTDNEGGDNEVDVARASTITGHHTVNETKTHQEIGVRPMIAVRNEYLVKPATGGHGGGGGSVVPLVLGIIFSIFGLAGIAIFFMLWKKGKLIKIGKTKMPMVAIASIGGGLLISVIGICMLFATTGGTGYGYSLSSPVGYYTCTEFTLDVASPTFGYHYYYGLTRDFKVYRYYHDDFDEGSSMTHVLHPYGSIGSWKIVNRKLIITAGSDWELFAWEDPVTEYYSVDSRYGFARGAHLKEVGNKSQESYQVQGYRWSHASTKDPVYKEIIVKNTGVYDL